MSYLSYYQHIIFIPPAHSCFLWGGSFPLVWLGVWVRVGKVSVYGKYALGNWGILVISWCLACDSYSYRGWPLMLYCVNGQRLVLATLFPLLCHLMGFGVLFPIILFLWNWMPIMLLVMILYYMIIISLLMNVWIMSKELM